MKRQHPSSGNEQYFQQLEWDLRNKARTLLMTQSSNGLKAEVSTKQLTKLLSTLCGELMEDQAFLGMSLGEILSNDPNEWTLWRVSQVVRSIEIVSMTLNDLSNRLAPSIGPSCA
jgi:hypothetical protein